MFIHDYMKVNSKGHLEIGGCDAIELCQKYSTPLMVMDEERIISNMRAYKNAIDKFLKDHGASIQVREGYGTTECVTASCLTPIDYYREGSIGIPFPDTFYKICVPETNDEAKVREYGEICIAGPTLMKEYLNHPKETCQTLRLHDDGKVYLHTGDLGYMDEDGFIYFVQRLKRMIVTSGYNVYPSQIENIIDSHEAVQMSCVIGVKDPVKMQKIKETKNSFTKG